MTLPNQTTTLQDPGLEKVSPASVEPVIMGPCSGTASTSENTVYTYNSAADVVNNHGHGPAVEAACEHLVRAGGPIRFIEMTQSADGALGAFSGGAGTIADDSSAPYNWYDVRIKIILGGAAATATFQYSLDGGRSYSATYTTAATFTIPDSGLDITMTGTFTAAEIYTAVATGPIFTSSELDTAFVALTACQLNWDYGILAGRYATATLADAVFSALDADRIAMGEPHQYKPWYMDAGGDNKATTLSTFTSTSKWIGAAYGLDDMVTQTPVAGYKQPALPTYMHAILKAGVADLSEHWGRKASGPLPGIAGWTTEFGSPLSHDEEADPGLDDAGFMTVRHFQGDASGQYYITRGRMKAPVGSDFERWELSRLWSATYRVIRATQDLFQNRTWAVKSDGTLVEAEAAAAEAKVRSAMKGLLHVRNIEGTVGHVSINGTDPGYYYTISRTQNVLATNTIVTEWGIRPRAPSEYITTTGGFTAQTA